MPRTVDFSVSTVCEFPAVLREYERNAYSLYDFKKKNFIIGIGGTSCVINRVSQHVGANQQLSYN